MLNLPYNKYHYIFPPRPEHKAELHNIGIYDDGTYIAQPKYNGSCCMVFMDPAVSFLRIMNRHREDITLVHRDKIDFMGAYRGTGFMVLAGELLNKNKLGEDGEPFNQKFITWDIIVYNGAYLVGNTVEYRLNLLEELYPCTRMRVNENGREFFNHICGTGITGIYRAPSYTGNFQELYNELVKVDLYEGLVLKRRNAKLALGYSERNNSDYQIKFRKETKNYKF